MGQFYSIVPPPPVISSAWKSYMINRMAFRAITAGTVDNEREGPSLFSRSSLSHSIYLSVAQTTRGEQLLGQSECILYTFNQQPLKSILSSQLPTSLFLQISPLFAAYLCLYFLALTVRPLNFTFICPHARIEEFIFALFCFFAKLPARSMHLKIRWRCLVAFLELRTTSDRVDILYHSTLSVYVRKYSCLSPFNRDGKENRYGSWRVQLSSHTNSTFIFIYCIKSICGRDWLKQMLNHPYSLLTLEMVAQRFTSIIRQGCFT